jgi:hypothetical protein
MSWIYSQVLVDSVSVLKGPVSTQWRFVSASRFAKRYCESTGLMCRASMTCELSQKRSL